MEPQEEKIRKITSVYYSKPEVQEAIFSFSQNREIVPRYFEGFGKRPDSFQYKNDIFELVKKGATSFHSSEELWSDPLRLSTGLNEKQLNELRTGWDLLIDIDCKYFDYSKKAAESVIAVLKKHGLKNIGIKYSVSGDTPLLVKNKENICLLPISEIILRLKKNEKLEILSLNKKRKLKFSKIYDFLEHKDTIYEIKHSQSTIPVKVTGHHSVFIWDKGEIIQKKVTELKNGDFLISYNSKKNPFSQDNLVISNKFEFSKNQYSKKIISNKIKITKELMRLIGYFLAEGHVTNIINQVGFSFNKKEKEYIEDVKELLKKITGKKISIRHPNISSTQILIHSKEWANFFDNFCGKKKDKHIPKFAFRVKKELFLELLKGYIRGDGYKVGEYSIVAKSVSKKLITEFVWLCKLNGISCNLSFEKNKGHSLSQGTFFKGNKSYVLRIPKSELETLEFHRKRNKLSPYARDKIFPVDGLKEVYKQIKPKMFNSHRVEQMTLNKKNANLNRIKRVLEWFYKFKGEEIKSDSKKILENYKKLFNSDISVVEIKKVMKKNKELVYDVSVDETESFFGNYYPLLLHNSGNKGFHILVPWKAFPKTLSGAETKNLFPELPKKIISYIRFKAEEELRKILPENFYAQFKNSGIRRGIKCNNCKELSQEFKLVNYFCPRCKREELKKISEKKDFRCPECYSVFEILSEKTIYECKKCSTDSKKNPENFSKSVEIDIFGLMGLDLILVSPRHLFRVPYSLHEKTALASVVLSEKELSGFQPKDANPFEIKIKNFLPDSEEGEASELVLHALDWYRENFTEEPEKKNFSFKPIQIKIEKISDEMFSPSIRKILLGLEDGRKRALFILINLFRSISMEKDELEKRIYSWNSKNKPPLKEGYIKSQILWSYRNKLVLPPNFDKDYYKGIGIIPDDEELRLKNPVNYIVQKTQNERKFKKGKN